MAKLDNRLPHNSAGDFFVDTSCIDCDTCRSLAPAVFARAADFQQSFVKHQPASEEERRQALMALVACPTCAIGTVQKVDVRPAIEAFPAPIAEDVYYCGFAAESSFGAASYLIRRPGGNVLVDSPRASKPLVARLRALGGVRTMFLTHRDDVADHVFFRRELGCERILHRADVSAATLDVERPLDGDQPITLAPDLCAIPVPGHTPGSTALLYREEFLFSGDHVWWSPGRSRLHASRCVNWFSWERQVQSLRRLLDFRFRWILPGHGRRYQAPDPETMRRELARLLATLHS
jgi:glyoxylase-like metal-dependent hydrolase (beta-lactamase superfamily II)/ferredoxin